MSILVKNNKLNLDNSKFLTHLIKWLPVIIGLIVLYLPTAQFLANNLWNTEDQAHGPIILLVVFYLFWQKREQFALSAADKPVPILGGITLFFGLLCYVAGRSQDIFILDLASQIFVLAGIFLFMRGLPMLKALWFPLFFIIFMLPFPLDSLTLPMKMAVSYVTETILFWFDYPIAREGVILQIGQYQLLVADMQQLSQQLSMTGAKVLGSVFVDA